MKYISFCQENNSISALNLENSKFTCIKKLCINLTKSLVKCESNFCSYLCTIDSVLTVLKLTCILEEGEVAVLL